MTMVVALTEEDARALTDRIREDAKSLWVLLLESHDREAWRVLGYASWRAYATTEFSFSNAQAYYLLNQGRALRAIEAATGGAISDSNMLEKITIRTATDIRPRLDEVVSEISQRVDAGEVAETVVDEVIAKYRTPDGEKPDHRQTMAKPSLEILSNAVHSLQAASVAVRSLSIALLPDDAPADRWVKEIDRTVATLRAFRKELRNRYDIS